VEFYRNLNNTTDWSRNTSGSTDRPPTRLIKKTFQDRGGQHNEILQNFTNAILNSEQLIAPAAEGLRSLELANALLLSSVQREPVSLPVSGREVESMLETLVATSETATACRDAESTEDIARSQDRA
jgi:hypothetical protein